MIKYNRGSGMKSDKPSAIIKDKKVLIVDDEIDVLDILTELLDECHVERASSFEEAKVLLESHPYDIAVLDIMGVLGYDLLKIADEKNIPVIVLTAHALTKENLLKSIREGASYYASKDKILKIGTFIADVLEAREMNKNIWKKWFESLGNYYDKRFGSTDWRDMEEEFWEKKLREV